MTPLCPLCAAPIIVAREAVGGDDLVLNAEPMKTLRGFMPEFRVVVDGFAWTPPDIVAAIAIETSTSELGAFNRAVQELDWYRTHVCTAGLAATA